MLIKEGNRTYFVTRQNYGTYIEIFYDESKNTVKFQSGKIRESLEIPENEEDKKFWLVINSIKELITTKRLVELNVAIYEQTIQIMKKDSDEIIKNKICKALIKYVGFEEKTTPIFDDVKNCILKALLNYEIDIY